MVYVISGPIFDVIMTSLHWSSVGLQFGGIAVLVFQNLLYCFRFEDSPKFTNKFRIFLASWPFSVDYLIWSNIIINLFFL